MICKVCNKEITEQDKKELIEQIKNKSDVDAKHHSCWIVSQIT